MARSSRSPAARHRDGRPLATPARNAPRAVDHPGPPLRHLRSLPAPWRAGVRSQLRCQQATNANRPARPLSSAQATARSNLSAPPSADEGLPLAVPGNPSALARCPTQCRRASPGSGSPAPRSSDRPSVARCARETCAASSASWRRERSARRSRCRPTSRRPYQPSPRGRRPKCAGTAWPPHTSPFSSRRTRSESRIRNTWPRAASACP